MAADGTLAAATADAPRATRSMADVLAGAEPFNVEAGRLLVRRYGPVPVEAVWDVLAGRPWRRVSHGSATVPLGGPVELLRSAAATEGSGPPDDGRLFLGRHGRWGRFVESYHLRVRLLADLVAAARRAVAVTGRPLLSVTPDAFQVRLPEAAVGLPFLWSAQVMLADPGQAVPVAVPGSDLVLFQPPAGNASVYRPTLGRDVSGTAVMRVRQVVADGARGVVVDGTLATAERVTGATLAWLRPVLGSGPVDLYARLEPAAAGDGSPPGEHRFRTVGQRLSATATRELQAAAGVPMPGVPFATVTTATTASDLYALAVIAVQSLIVDPASYPLPLALDDLTSLARRVAADHDPAVGLGLRVRAAFEADPRWMASLGTHRLVTEPMSPAAALDLIPVELWCDTLAALIRMLPAVGPDSTCPTWDDPAAAAVPTRPFDPALADLDGLIRRSRSLIVIDWRYNREVRAAIRTRLAANPSAGRAAASPTAAW